VAVVSQSFHKGAMSCGSVQHVHDGAWITDRLLDVYARR